MRNKDEASSGRSTRRWAIAFALFAAGCGARFEDLREPSPGPSDSGTSRTEPDGAISGAADGAEHVVAEGTWTGRNGDDASGHAQLVVNSRGDAEVRLGSDFRTGGTPAPVVVLSSRETLGTAIDTGLGDVELGVLEETRGPLTFNVSGGDSGQRYVFVFCKTYGLETARAVLSGDGK